MTNQSQKNEKAYTFEALSEDFLSRINQETNLQALVQLIRTEARRVLKAEMASIILLDREQCELWFPLPENGKFLRMDARLGIAGACVSSEEVLNVKDVQSDLRFFSGIDSTTEHHTQTL